MPKPRIFPARAAFAVVAGAAIAVVPILMRESPDAREVRTRIESRFSPELAPDMLRLRRAIEDPNDTPDADLLRWCSASQVGSDQDRRQAATLFLGLAIDWPASRVQQHRATLTHIAGELIANSNGDEGVAWAGLAMACEVGSQAAVRDLADGVHRSAASPEWKALYAEAYGATPRK